MNLHILVFYILCLIYYIYDISICYTIYHIVDKWLNYSYICDINYMIILYMNFYNIINGSRHQTSKKT